MPDVPRSHVLRIHGSGVKYACVSEHTSVTQHARITNDAQPANESFPMSLMPVPRTVLKSHSVILGKTGAGKSSLLRVVVEDLLDQGKRVCVVDPKGDWWGLKVNADGKTHGYKVILFGDFKEGGKTDVPLNEHSGKHVAELITTGNRPCVIGFRGWMPGKMTRFWIDFASTLFNGSGGELYVVIDECHNFMPKGKILDPLAGQCLHWSNRLLSEGRGLGLIFLIASQRPQKVHNDSLTCCETLFSMRVVHPADRNATKEWIQECGDNDNGKLVLNSLAGLNKGEAFVWSPENNYGPKSVQFPMFRSFDSFAPPQGQRKVSSSSWADVDLDEVKGTLASVIEEAKANDPKELKKQVADLQNKIRKLETAKPVAAPAAEPVIQEKFIVRDTDIALVTDALTHCRDISIEILNEINTRMKPLGDTVRGLQALHERLTQLKKPVPPVHLRVPEPARVTSQAKAFPAVAAGLNGDWRPSKCAAAILSALMQFSKPLSKNRVALLSGYSVTSSTFSNGLSECRVNGCIEGSGDNLTATEKARQLGLNYTELPTGDRLREYWINKVGASSCPGKLLATLIQFYPDKMSKTSLAEHAGFSETSSTFSNALSTLRTLELITRDPLPSAHPDLFA